MGIKPGRKQRLMYALSQEIASQTKSRTTSRALDDLAWRRSDLQWKSWVAHDGGTMAHYYRTALFVVHFLCCRCGAQWNLTLTLPEYRRMTTDIHPRNPTIGMRHLVNDCNGGVVVTGWRPVTSGSRQKIADRRQRLVILHHQAEGVPGHHCEWCRPELSPDDWCLTWWEPNEGEKNA